MASIKVGKQLHPEICNAYKSGKTLSEVAVIYGVSTERIRQILEMHGLNGKSGGVSKKVEARKIKEEERFMMKHGCTREQFDSIKGHYTEKTKSPWCAFKSQRRNAISRGVEWKFVFWDWWRVWMESGKWEFRGRGQCCYCMCRIGDSGAYEIGNVYIGTVSHNSSLGRTLAIERGVLETPVCNLIKAVGGPTEASKLIGIKPNYISQLSVRNIIPKKWFEDGKVEALISKSGMTLSIDSFFEITKRV
ncbi:MAG: hypothetical protein [Bacteriophage sp.]|nr:MAG: hypothetical protein [Bacteriophage sp.]